MAAGEVVFALWEHPTRRALLDRWRLRLWRDARHKVGSELHLPAITLSRRVRCLRSPTGPCRRVCWGLGRAWPRGAASRIYGILDSNYRYTCRVYSSILRVMFRVYVECYT